MFFTRLGMWLAYLGFGFGVISLLLAVFFAFISPDVETSSAAARAYLAADTTGEAIDRALQRIVLSIALGVLCEISFRLNSRDARQEGEQ